MNFNKNFEEIIEKLSLDDRKKIDNFFIVLNKNLILDFDEKKKIQGDFCNAILYYINNNFSLGDILKLLNVNYLGDFYSKKNKQIFELDDSAKILALLTSYDFTSMFRVSIYLKEDIVPEILQIALNFTIKRFPIFATKLIRGFFWHYLEVSRKRYCVEEESDIPCQPIDFLNSNSQLFRVLYFRNRISIEFFHVLTDGTGAVEFLKVLLVEYLRLLGKKIFVDETIIDINSNLKKEEIENAFDKVPLNSNFVVNNNKFISSLRGKISKNRPCQIINFKLNTEKLKLVSKKYNTTVTGYFLSLMFIANKYTCKKLESNSSILVPFNIRKFYSSKTLKNFSLFYMMNLSYNEIFDISSVVLNVNEKLKEMSSEKTIIDCVSLMKKIIKFMGNIPLFMKRTGSKFIYALFSKNNVTNVFSNLGVIKLPKSILDDIESMDFILNTSIKNSIICSTITVNNITTFSITKITKNVEFENKMYELLSNDGLIPIVEGSEIYED